MAEYNSKMNTRLYELCASLTEAERKTDIKLYFGSIHRTLEHLLYGDMAWLLRFMDKESEMPNIDQEIYLQFEELALARLEWDHKLITWSDSVSEKWLEKDFSYTSNIDKKLRTKKAWLLVTHMFNHQTHHRGQLSTALNQLGLDFGVTDLPFLID